MFEATPEFLPALITNGPFVVVPLLGLVLIALLARGASRAVGVIGCGLLLVGGMMSLILQLAAPVIFRRSGGVSWLGVFGAVDAFVTLAGLATLITAVCLGRRPAARSGSALS